MAARLTLPGLVAVLVVLAAACDRPPRRDAERSAAPPPENHASDAARSDNHLSPIETVARVHEYRRSGKAALIEPHIAPDRQAAVMELIQAVDRLEWANEVLQASARKNLGLNSAGTFDYSQVANIIGVFSRDVEIVDERIEGNEAVVTIQVAGRVPLDEVRLMRDDGHWLITTDPPIVGLAGELRRLADIWIDTARRLETEHLTATELKRELEARQAPIGRRLKALLQPPKP